MPLPPIFFRLFRKPIVILVLMTMVIVTGSYATHYYTWSVSYTITPLTETKVVVNLGTHSGATSVPAVPVGSAASPVTHIWVPTGKKLDVYFLVPHTALDQLEQHFYSIKVHIHLVQTRSEEINLVITLILVLGGTHEPVSLEPVSGLEGIWKKIPTLHAPITGMWKVWFTVCDIWTGAVETSTGPMSFPIYVYAVEG